MYILSLSYDLVVRKCVYALWSWKRPLWTLIRHSRQVKTKVGPKLSRHRKIQYSHSQSLTVSTKILRHLEYKVVSEVGALTYFEFKLRKIVVCRFLTLFLIHYLTSMHERWIQLQWAVNWWSTAKSSYLGFPISISSCVGTFLKTATYCWVRKQVRPWPYRKNRLSRPCFCEIAHQTF